MRLLSARFERALDVLVRAFFRILDRIEDTAEGTIVEVLNKAEKRGIIKDAQEFRGLRLKRNTISHENLEDEGATIAWYILEKSPALLDALQKGRPIPFAENPAIGLP